jgi:hypothetical protein
MGTEHQSPRLSSDRLRLYLAADTGVGGRLQLVVATRSSTSSDFGTPAPVLGVQDSTKQRSDPALDQDERVIVFTESVNNNSTEGELRYAVRPDAGGSFGASAAIPTVNTGEEFDPVLGADGCDLYFSSPRDGGNFRLFHATVTK